MRKVLFLMTALALAACDTDTYLTAPDTVLTHDYEGTLAIDHATSEGILALVNSPDTTVDFLDVDVELDVRAAERIVAHRQGDDGYDGTWDDNPFDDLFELDDVGYVGPDAMEKLGDMAYELDLVPGIVVEGVVFTIGEEADTMLLVNLATLDELDFEAGLDARAAETIVYGRPYSNLVEVGDRPWVGPAALEQLRAYAGPWVDETPIE